MDMMKWRSANERDSRLSRSWVNSFRKRVNLIAVRSLGGLPKAARVWSESVSALTLEFDHGV